MLPILSKRMLGLKLLYHKESIILKITTEILIISCISIEDKRYSFPDFRFKVDFYDIFISLLDSFP